MSETRKTGEAATRKLVVRETSIQQAIDTLWDGDPGDVVRQLERLIECAPSLTPAQVAALELLTALQHAVARVEVANTAGNPILSAWLPDARAAIAKATSK